MFPRITPYRSGDDSRSFSMNLYLQHREYNALVGAALMTAALAVKLSLWGR
jgi:hypothetical protein